MRTVELVVPDQEPGVVTRMFGRNPRDQFLGRHTLALRADHDRRAVRILRTDVETVVAEHLLQPDPDVRLHRLDDVTEMQRPIRIGKGAGNQNLSHRQSVS